MKVQHNGREFTVEVTADGEGVVSHAGAVLLAETADRIGLTDVLSRGLAPMRSLVCPPGRTSHFAIRLRWTRCKAERFVRLYDGRRDHREWLIDGECCATGTLTGTRAAKPLEQAESRGEDAPAKPFKPVRFRRGSSGSCQA